MRRTPTPLIHRFIDRATTRPRMALAAAVSHARLAFVYEAALPHITDPEEVRDCLNRIAFSRNFEAIALYSLSQSGRPPLSIEA